MAMHKPKKQRRFQDGGDVEENQMKQRGLDASNKEAPVSFLQRLKMGNIDDPNSEAYKKFGAGRGRQDRDDADFAAEEARDKTARAQAGKASDGDVSPYDLRTEAAANAPSRVSTSSGQSSSGSKPSAAPKVDVPASQKAKTAAEYSDATDAMRNRSRMAANSANKKSSTTDALRAKSRREAAFEGAKRMANTPEAQAKRKAMEKGQALERVAPELALTGAGGFGLKTLHSAAKNLAGTGAKTTAKTASTGAKSPLRQKAEQLIREDKNPGRSVSTTTPKTSLSEKTKDLIKDDRAARSAGTSKQVTAKETPFKAAAKTKEREARAAKRRSEMLEENAKRYGLDPKAPGYESAIKAMRKDMGGKDFSFKKGGRVTASSASKRADGIAQRGKTRGRVY